jgi:hypothetical protein
MLRIIFLMLILMVPSVQTQTSPDWKVFNFFIGSWQGQSTGQWGAGKCDSQFQFKLTGTYLEAKFRTVTPPQEKMPKGEVHENLDMVSFDKARGKFIQREFNVEGFVNQYILTVSPDNKTLVWETEAIENIEPGWRARQTWRIVGPDEWVEIFELAPPGKGYVKASEGTYIRQR